MFDNAQNNQSSTPDPINGVPPVVPTPTPNVVPPIAPTEPAPMVLNEMGVVADNTQPVSPIMPAAPVEAMMPPVVPPMSEPMPTEAPVAPMAPDMPLAFAGAAPMPAVDPALVQKAEEIIGKPPASKKPWIVGAVVALVMMVVGAGSWYGYTQYAGEQARIAVVGNGGCAADTRSECNGCSNPDGNDDTYKCVWRSATGECKPGAQKCVGDGGTAAPDTISCAAASPGPIAGNGQYTYMGKNYAYCTGCTPGTGECVRGDLLPNGCGPYVSAKCGTPITYGANCTTVAPSAGSIYIKSCDCNSPAGEDTWFDKTGYCNQADATKLGATGQNYDEMGLCALKTTCNDGTDGTGDVSGPDTYICDDNGCTAFGATCFVTKYTCEGTNSNESCLDKPLAPKKSYTFDKGCGNVQQIDVQCGSNQHTASRTRINPPCESSPSPSASSSTTPTLTCTSITKNIADAAITVNGAVTFTCLGAVAPAGATNLTYQFRSKIGTAAYTTMTNVTATTTSLTPTQCGVQYQVECRACGTIAGQSQCTATWTGATP